MPARLILNADDFGLTRGVNRAVAELHDCGAITSATLMANGPAFSDAVSIARASPALGIGCHVVLVDGLPLAPPHTIPTLLASDGLRLRSSLSEFLVAVLRGQIAESDILRETTAQIERMQQSGIHPTHLDTHKHTHMLPGVARPLLKAAELSGITAVRNPFEPAWSAAQSRRSSLRRRLPVRLLRLLQPHFLDLPQIRSGQISTTKGTLGIAATGTLDTATLNAMLASLPDGTWEMVCHPGYTDSDLDAIGTRLRSTREIERLALTSVFCAAKDLQNPSRLQLINYRDVTQKVAKVENRSEKI